MESKRVVIFCGKGPIKKGISAQVQMALSELRAEGGLGGVVVEAACTRGRRAASNAMATGAGGAAQRCIIVKNRASSDLECPEAARGLKTVVINELTPGMLKKALRAVTAGDAWLDRTHGGSADAWARAVAKGL